MNRLASIIKRPLWAIHPAHLPILLREAMTEGSVPFLGSASFRTSASGAEASIMKAKESSKVVIIPIEGVLTQNDSWAGTTYDFLNTALDHAEADSTVKRVILSVDSPGGEVTGLPETAAAIARVASKKPVTARVTGMAASAAYWLASQASDIVLTPSGEVGSVGVRQMHVDISQSLEQAGIKVTEMSSGEFKTEGSPFQPLSDESKAYFETQLQALHSQFIDAISAGRGTRVSAEVAAKRFGEGRMFTAPEALKNGMIDAVMEPRQYLRGVIRQISASAEVNEGDAALVDYEPRIRLEKCRF